MRQTFWLRLLAGVLALGCASLPADAAGPLSLTVRPVVARARSQAPQTIEVFLDSSTSQLVQGRLHLKWYLGKRLVHEFVSSDLAIAAGGQRLRLMLPPIVVHSERTPVTGYARFVTEAKVIDFPEIDLVLPADWRRAFIVSLVQPDELQLPESVVAVAAALPLEQFNPYPDTRSDIATYPARLTLEDLPVIAAGYAGFDILVLEGEGFQKLRAVQLSAIGDWVMAGGSAVIMPRGSLTARHVDLLNRLSNAPPAGTGDSPAEEAVYALDEKGGLANGARGMSVVKRMSKYRSRLGRTVVIHDAIDVDQDLATAEWRETAAFLWKVRESQVEAIRETGKWVAKRPEMATNYKPPKTFAPQRDDLAKSFRQFLMPERIDGLPFSVVVVILSLFLLTIAPGDYFLLGRLNCRKYTWWFFAFVSAAFTLFTVKIADNHMGSTDYRTSLTFVDMGRQAAVARTSRFELVFVATQRMVESDLKNCLYADLTDRAAQQDQRQTTFDPYLVAEEEELDRMAAVSEDLPVFDGTVPGAYSVHQQLRQWSPRITRQTFFGNDQPLLDLAKIDWNALQPDGWRLASGKQALRDKLISIDPEAEVLLFNGTQVYRMTKENHGAEELDGQKLDPVTSQIVRLIKSTSLRGTGGLAAEAQNARPMFQYGPPSAPSPAGFFSIVSQISPTGGENLEDLALLDGSDPNQWLLAVVVRRDGNWIVVRKLFTRDP